MTGTDEGILNMVEFITRNLSTAFQSTKPHCTAKYASQVAVSMIGNCGWYARLYLVLDGVPATSTLKGSTCLVPEATRAFS